MHLVNEEDVAATQIGENRCQVSGPLDGGTGGDLEAHVHLTGADVSQGCLSQPGRAVEQDMVQRLAAPPGGLDQDAQVVLDAILPLEFGQRLRTQCGIQRDILGAT